MIRLAGQGYLQPVTVYLQLAEDHYPEIIQKPDHPEGQDYPVYTETDLEFPVPEPTEKHYIYDKTYAITFRGNTVVDIDPRDTEQMEWREGRDTGPPEWKTHIHPIYQRDHFRATKAPMHTVKRFVANKILPLQ